MASRSPRGKSKPARNYVILADKVQLWALTNNTPDSATTKDLIEDLRQRRNWNYWANLRSNEILPEIRLPQLLMLRARYRQVLFLRNLMVFLPVTVTWIAISEAASAFSAFIDANQSSLVNFLQFWQDGYGFLSPIWRLSSVAFIDFLILAFIMILTIVLHGLGRSIDALTQKEQDLNVSERGSLTRELFDFFQRNQTISAITVDRTLVAALRDFNKTSQNLEKLTNDLSKSVKDFPIYLSVLREFKSIGSRLDKLERKADGTNSLN